MLRSEWSVASPIFRKCPKLASATRKQNANLAGVGFSNNPPKPDVCSRGGILEHSGRPPQFLDTQLHCPSNFKALFCCNCSFCFSLCSKKRFSICGSGGIFKLRWTCLWATLLSNPPTDLRAIRSKQLLYGGRVRFLQITREKICCTPYLLLISLYCVLFLWPRRISAML